MAYLKIMSLFTIVLTLTIGCSEHCDDEDYTREETEKKAVQNDSLQPVR